jgi:hypothetical protein
MYYSKAHLNLQFLMRFSLSDGCERVHDRYCSLYPLVYIHQKKIAAKIASANGSVNAVLSELRTVHLVKHADSVKTVAFLKL